VSGRFRAIGQTGEAPACYQDFDLLIEQAGAGVYQARVLRAPGGRARNSFQLSSDVWDLAALLADLTGPLRDLRPVEGSAGQGQPAAEPAARLGGALFQAAFNGDVGACLRVSQEHAKRRGEGLRVRLYFDEAPDLAGLPWEILYERRARRFLILSRRTTIVRCLELPGAVHLPLVEPPIRLLVVLASPRGLPRLAAEEEWSRISAALAGAGTAAFIVPERLPKATLPALGKALRDGACHALHFGGHGLFDRGLGDGVLHFEQEEGGARRVDSHRLGVLLDHPHLRLVVLNACYGGRSSGQDALSGLAQSLVLGGVPAVVAMQFPVTDRGAIVFAGHLYQRVAEGMPIDAAVAASRREMFLLGTPDWGAPVLFLTAPDGRLFDVPAATGEPGGGGSRPAPAQAGEGRGADGGERADEGQGPAPGPVGDPAGGGLEASGGNSDGGHAEGPVGDAGAPAARRSRWWAMPAATLILVGSYYLATSLLPAGGVSPGRSPHPPRSAASDPHCPPPPGVEMELVLIQPGTFQMGSTLRDDDAEPVHAVTLTHPFCIGAHEVTQGQWEAVLGADAKPSRFPGLDRPVERVSWDDAQRFLAALNRLAGGPFFRLPTEAEWEYAARAGTTTAYSFGDEPQELPRFGNCLSRELDDRFDRTAPVGSFAPNPWGLFDVHGNVWEWVADRYAPYPAAAAVDPTGPATGDERVRRGGGSSNRTQLCRSATRSHSKPEARSQEVGLRVAREAR
jgi:formylglycine-generating enzyme required for sulfatase activity